MKLYHFIFILSIISIKSKFTKLVFEEKFSGKSLNTSLWEFDIGNVDGWGNNELEYYRKNSENIFIKDEQLHIVAKVKKIKHLSYTSAKITTKKTFQFTYGKVEARIKLPLGKGIWPAFWMLGANIDEKLWPSCGEIDILEAVNTENIIYNTLHWGDTTHLMKDSHKQIENVNEFHIYTLTWTKDEIKMFVDDDETYSVDLNELDTDTFQKPFYLLLNLAVGGDFTKHEKIDESVFPLEMVIDYIRIYQEEENYKYSKKLLIWEDNFDSEKLNTSIWKYSYGNNGGWGTGQLQYYTDSINNVYLSDSNLNLKAIKENYEGSSYTSGRINTKGTVEFTYGVIETRMKFPLVDGVSPKIMLYGLFKDGVWPECGEIDAIVGKDSFNRLISGIYWGKDLSYYNSYTFEDYDISQFNDYTIIWDKISITIYLDDLEIYKIYIKEDQFKALHNPFYIALYLLVGGSTVDKKVNDSSFPVEMSVDYIRVYQYELNNKVGDNSNYYIETPTDNSSEDNDNDSGNNNNNSSEDNDSDSGNNNNNSSDNNESDSGNNNNSSDIYIEENENSLTIELNSFLLLFLLAFLL